MIPPRKTQILRGILPSQRWLWRSSFWRVKNLGLFLAEKIGLIRQVVVPRIIAIESSRKLAHQLGPKRGARTTGVVVVAAHYGDHEMIWAFLEYHRRIGIHEFVFLDLSTDGKLSQRLKDEKDCAVWRPGNVKTAVNATSWLNALRARYASRRWCLSLDTSDAFVFYRCESRKISDYTEFLEAECRDHAFGVLVEMYGDAPTTRDAHGQRDLQYFDAFGYVSREQGRFKNKIVRGGPQRRLLYNSRPGLSPNISRIPLIRWRWYYSYMCGTRLAAPLHLNHPHARWHSSPTCCVLRYALLCDPQTLDNAARWEILANLTAPVTSSYTGAAKLQELRLRHAFSRRYMDTKDLVESGLLNPGQWF